ncbi:hypothetical protein N480_07485 [Pseudoalteromonas luteoviolacea S2607]|uniref:glycosyltransferase family A protein n=1 Tax=Pseudoalteromonas luteoviolacea TaxID=43657 RepID=UPI0007B0764E|nr:glycosyltransferase family 2 protein [Pseudoalteromonas luteoviolacea]KZN29558.1 hypothetical protein N480_07485 [Pseudoalteromonas luteoviolacea S2607]
MRQKLKKVSVLMLAYNHGKFILDAIQSVEKNISDKFELEIIVLDDGSSDNTVDVVKTYMEDPKVEIKLIENEHQGIHAIAKNLNTLIRASSGDFICFLTSDDMFTENRFEQQLEMMEQDLDVVLCYANGSNIINGVNSGLVHKKVDLKLLEKKCTDSMYEYVTTCVPSLFVQSALIRKSFVSDMDEVYDESLIADDWVLNIRLFNKMQKESKKFDFIDKPVFLRILHGGNTSSNLPVHFERVVQVINKYCRSPEKLYAKTISEFFILALLQGKVGLAFKFVSKLGFKINLFGYYVYYLFNLFFLKLKRN